MSLNRNLGGFGGTANISGYVANTQITGLITAPQIAPGVIPAGGIGSSQFFTSPGTFNIPPSTTKIKVTVIGGGGNGASATSASSCTTYGGGGGGGGGIISYICAPFPVTAVPVTVGGAAGTSSFGTYVSATGGSSAVNATPAAGAPLGGAGGAGAVGPLAPAAKSIKSNGSGGTGLVGVSAGITLLGYNNAPNTLKTCGAGGASAFLYGWFNRGPYATNTPGQPGAPVGYGVGGSGAVSFCTPTTYPGGTGAPGVVIVEY